MDTGEQGDIDDLQILFPKYTKSELETIYLTRGKDFKKTCAFVIQKMTSANANASVTHNSDAIFSGPSGSDQENTIEKVMKMANYGPGHRLAKRFGMNIYTVTWEDCARDKNSCWGPCICDMTLRVPEDNCLPVMRYPNFNDVTWDVPIGKIFLMVGNETGEQQLRRVSLKTYLDTIVSKNRRSLYCDERDSHVLFSAQACMLPAAPGYEPVFNVALYSYQSYYKSLQL